MEADRHVQARSIVVRCCGCSSPSRRGRVLNAARQALPAGIGLTGQYYANANWSGQPVISVVDRAAVNGADARDAGTTSRRRRSAPPGTAISASSGRDCISSPRRPWIDRGCTSTTRWSSTTPAATNGQAGSIELDRGPHRVTLEYVHVARTTPTLKWEWVYDGDSDKTYKVVPRWALSRRPVSTDDGHRRAGRGGASQRPQRC